MATRRMFSSKIINSARFIKMPASTQMLYFHFGLNADDDGVVEAYGIMRMLSCSEDDLKILVDKNFIRILNDDLVTYITDWREHNLIRADRKVDSIYKNLLIKMIEDVKIIEAKRRADLKPEQIVTENMLSDGRPDAAECPHRLGKDRLGKDSIVQTPTPFDNQNEPVENSDVVWRVNQDFEEQEPNEKLNLIHKGAIANWHAEAEGKVQFTRDEWACIENYAISYPSLPRHEIFKRLLILHKWADEDALDIVDVLMTSGVQLKKGYMKILEDDKGNRYGREMVIAKRRELIARQNNAK